MKENQIILTKQSTDVCIKRYFESILTLSRCGNQFPIDLNEVWRIAYERKDYAVDALKRDFFEGVDYIKTASVDTEPKNGGQNRIDYYLTVPCLEYFIARKVRGVFDVYRDVFHAVGNAAIEATPEQFEALSKILKGDYKFEKKTPTRSIKREVSAKVVRAHYAAIEAKKSLLHLSESAIAMMVNKTDEALGIEGQLIEYVPSKGVLKPITELLKKHKVEMSAMVANKKLAALGILEQHSRNTRNGIKKFWALSSKGLEYGQNEVSPNNPKETQPLYFEDKFSSLLVSL